MSHFIDLYRDRFRFQIARHRAMTLTNYLRNEPVELVDIQHDETFSDLFCDLEPQNRQEVVANHVLTVWQLLIEEESELLEVTLDASHFQELQLLSRAAGVRVLRKELAQGSVHEVRDLFGAYWRHILAEF